MAFCREEPAVVFLQEVVPIAFDLIQRLLPEYQSHAGQFSLGSSHRTALSIFREYRRLFYHYFNSSRSLSSEKC